MEYKQNKKTFSYLMNLLYKEGVFSELHLPSTNKIARCNNCIRMIKMVPTEFKRSVEEILDLIRYSGLTNIEVLNVSYAPGYIEILLSSKTGKILKWRGLSLSEKFEILDLFSRYHKEISHPQIKLTREYNQYFNKDLFNNNLFLLINKIESKERIRFDTTVLKYLKEISAQKLPEVNYSRFVSQNVHGDFSQGNIIRAPQGLMVIDLEMAHKGFIEIELVFLLSQLFGFGTKRFFIELKKYYKNNLPGKRITSQLFDAFLRHKVMDLSVFKAAYFTNKEKYNQLKIYLLSVIRENRALIENSVTYRKKFDSL